MFIIQRTANIASNVQTAHEMKDIDFDKVEKSDSEKNNFYKGGQKDTS